MPDRILRETIRTSANVNKLTDFQFRLWVYLITYVNDDGCGRADAQVLKTLVFPFRPGVTIEQIKCGIDAMATYGMIELFEKDGESWFRFPKFLKHQDRPILAKSRTTKPFVPPTREEVRAYARERRSKVDPDQFYEYFTLGDWKDSEGKPVKAWKQKFVTWEKMQSQRQQREKKILTFMDL